MISVRKSIRDLVPYPPGKPIEELTREYGIKEVVKLASNENPLGPSPKAQAAIIQATSHLHRYPDGSGYYLKKAISHKNGLPSDDIILGNGSNEIIDLAVRTFLKPGEEVISPVPSFLVYGKIVQAMGGKNILVPLKDFSIDLKGILNHLGPRIRIIIINNPNNPTGTIIYKKEWENFLRKIPSHILIILDEAYIDFVEDPGCPIGTDYHPNLSNLLIIRTFSKAYGLAGLRIGYGIANPELVDYMNRVRQPFNVNSLAQAGALAALEDQSFYNKTQEVIRSGKRFLEDGLSRMGLPYIPSQTNFLLVKMPVKAQWVYEQMLKKGVIIRSMKSYGLEEYIRVNVGIPRENQAFLRTLKEVLKVYAPPRQGRREMKNT